MIFRKIWVLWSLSQVVLPALKKLWMLSWVWLAKVEISYWSGSFQSSYVPDVTALQWWLPLDIIVSGQHLTLLLIEGGQEVGGWVIINKDNKYNNCCYHHHSWYNLCKMHAWTLAYIVSIFQLLGRILRYACGWLAATAAQREVTTWTLFVTGFAKRGLIRAIINI